jgi:tRNA/rRNA methyltransferase
MSNFGARRLRVVNPYEVAFREARSAMGAAKLLAAAEEYNSVAEAIADCSLVVGTTAGGRREFRNSVPSCKVALLFGSERFGLSNQDLSHCHWLMTVPTRTEHSSMNLGQAVAVCMYEIARSRKALPVVDKKPKKRQARSEEVERITTLLLEALRISGYVQPRTTEVAEEKLRRLIRRLQIEQPDAAILQGMLRQINWKLGNLDPQKERKPR